MEELAIVGDKVQRVVGKEKKRHVRNKPVTEKDNRTREWWHVLQLIET
jgi:hypothetical protein